jgi:hypothetical protein
MGPYAVKWASTSVAIEYHKGHISFVVRISAFKYNMSQLHSEMKNIGFTHVFLGSFQDARASGEPIRIYNIILVIMEA